MISCHGRSSPGVVGCSGCKHDDIVTVSPIPLRLPLLPRSGRGYVAYGIPVEPEDPFNNSNSPYRGKNYKLLLDVITRAAIKAYRSELRIVGDRFTLNWVERFTHKNEMEGGPQLKVK